MELKRNNYSMRNLTNDKFQIPNASKSKLDRPLGKVASRPALGEICNVPRDVKKDTTKDTQTKPSITRKTSFTHVRSKVDSNLHAAKSTSNLTAKVSNNLTRVSKRQENTSTKTVIFNKFTNKNAPTSKVNQTLTKSCQDLSKTTNQEMGLSYEMIKRIEMIDAADKQNPLLLVEYKNDIYSYLHSLEAKYALRENFLKGMDVNSKMRVILINWLIDVHSQFGLLLETLHMTISILDRFLQEVDNVVKHELQLVGVCAMIIACKYEEIYMPDFNDFVLMCDSTYTKKEIRDMECTMLRILQFNLSPPLPVHFLRRYSKVGGAEPIHHALAKYFIELMLLDYSTCHYKPSEISAAAICLALTLVNNAVVFPKAAWTPVLRYFSTYEYSRIEPIVCKLAKIISDSKHSNKTITNKYSNPKFMKVALRAELQSILLKKLASKV